MSFEEQVEQHPDRDGIVALARQLQAEGPDEYPWGFYLSMALDTWENEGGAAEYVMEPPC